MYRVIKNNNKKDKDWSKLGSLVWKTGNAVKQAVLAGREDRNTFQRANDEKKTFGQVIPELFQLAVEWYDQVTARQRNSYTPSLDPINQNDHQYVPSYQETTAQTQSPTMGNYKFADDDYMEVDTAATRSFRGSVMRRNEFRRTNGQKDRPASYNDYLEATIDQWLTQNLLNDTEAATLLVQYGLIEKTNPDTIRQNASTTTQDKIAHQSETGRSERFESIKNKLINDGFTTSMTAEDVDDFLYDSQLFMKDTINGYSNLTWEQATSDEYKSKRNETGADLTTRAGKVRTYLNANKESINPEVYENYMQYLTDFAEFQNQSSRDFEKAYRSYGEFETKKDYDEAVQVAQWQDKYDGMSHAERKYAISKLEEGPEKEWLTYYTKSKMTALDYTKDSQAVNGQIGLMIALQDEYNYNVKRLRAVASSSEEYQKLIDRQREIYQLFGDLDERIEALRKERWELDNGLKYNFLSENEDYAAKSVELYGRPFSSYLTYNPDEASDHHLVMTKEEFANFYYLYNTAGSEAAREYLSYLEYDLDARRQEQKAAKAQKLANEHPVWANIASVGHTLESGIGYLDILGQNIDKKITEAITGEYAGPINYNSPAMTPSIVATTIRQTRAQNIADKYGVIDIDPEEHPMWASLLNGHGLADVYQLGMSMVDSAAVAGLATVVGPGAAALLGGSAATQGVLNAVANGATDEQALAMGTLNGAFEMLFEKYSLEKLLGSGGKNFLDAAWRQMLAEGSEEGLTTVANNMADILIMAEKSGYMKKAQEYVDAGLSDNEAMQKALTEMCVDLGWDILGGMVSGLLMGGGKSLATNAAQQFTNDHTGKTIPNADSSLTDLMNAANEVSPVSLEQRQNDLTSPTNKVNPKPTARSIGQLNQTVQTAANQTTQTDVANQLVNKGISSKKADGIASAIVARLNGQELNRTQRNVLSSALGSSAVRDTISEFIQKKTDVVDSVQNRVYDEGNITDGLTDEKNTAPWERAYHRVGEDRSGVPGMLREIGSMPPEAFSSAQRRGLTSEVDVFGDNDYATVMGGSSLYQVRKSVSEEGYDGGTAPDFYVGPNGKALPSQYKDWIGTNIQKDLLDQAENPQLQNAIKQLYRGNSFIGDGGTADVIRFEKQTGLMLGKNGGSHVQKGIDMAKYIENKILTQDLSPSDRALATQLLEDLYNAISR